MEPPPPSPEDYFAGHPDALDVFHGLEALLEREGLTWTVRTTTSQVAFRRHRAFAYLWMPGRYLTHPRTEVVLSIALGHRLPSERFAEVAHPATAVWMHHLDIRTLGDLDDEVAGWLREAGVAAG